MAAVKKRCSRTSTVYDVGVFREVDRGVVIGEERAGCCLGNELPFLSGYS